jgi:hypothetical protein
MPGPEQNPPRAHHLGTTILSIIGGLIAAIIIAVFIVSFFLDGFIRTRTERAMNEKLKGYHVTLGHAHLQLLGGSLTLRDLKIVQEEHPHPPVANFRLMRFSIEWSQLFFGRVVANVLVWHPFVHVDQTQFHAEKESKVPVRQKGWQDALESVYPFKINRLKIDDGNFTYIQDTKTPPLHLEHFNFLAENIRNIHSPNSVYPSSIYADLVIFGQGEAKIDGRANFLMEPFPGVEANYSVRDVPLTAVSPEIKNINLLIKGGILESRGYIEYSPKVTNVRVDDAALDKMDVIYEHTPQTKEAEAQRVATAGKEAEKQRNRPAVNIDVHRFEIRDGRFAFDDKEMTPEWNLYVSDTNLEIRNFSNHVQNGKADLDLRGDFMGVGKTEVRGTFVAAEPSFDVNYNLSDVPVGVFTPQIKSVNLIVVGGAFGSHGHLQYSPRITNIRIDDAAVNKVDVTYFHTAETKKAEAQRVTATGKQVQKQNNRPAVNLDLTNFRIEDSRFTFDNREMKPEWKLYMTDTNLQLSNLSNHQQHGLANVQLRGNFMGSGKTLVTGTFLPSMQGPEFNMNTAIQNTQLTSLNPLLQAYGRMEVAGGQFSVFSQMGVKNAAITGYVKPLFTNLEIYNRNQEKGRSIAHQAKELAIGATAHILKNPNTQHVATEVNLSGHLKNPNVSSWQALVEVLRNAFIRAILPGFDRSAHTNFAAQAG